MKSAILFVLLIYVLSKNSFSQLTITSGGQLYLSGNSQLTLHNTNFVNNGTFTASTSAVIFTGNLSSSVSGSQPIQFYEMEISKTSNASVSLQRLVDITHRINFTSGYLDLNNNNINLASAALLIGENQTSRVIGSNGGKVVITRSINAPAAENPGNLGAIFTSSQNMGNVTIGRGHQSQINTFGNGSSILRYFDISPTNNSGLNATLRFHYFDGELNSLGESALILWKSIDNQHWTQEGFTLRSVAANYVEKTGINSFSRWTLSTLNNPLPVQFLSFSSKCEKDRVILSWKTAQEQNSSHFAIQKSLDGILWTTIGTVQAAGNSTGERNYSYPDDQPSPKNYYRIAQYDIDGSHMNSLIIRSDCNAGDYFTITPNPARTSTFINITSSSSSQVIIKLFDSKGVLLKKIPAALVQGNNRLQIDLETLASGVYPVLLESANGQRRAGKIVLEN